MFTEGRGTIAALLETSIVFTREIEITESQLKAEVTVGQEEKFPGRDILSEQP